MIMATDFAPGGANKIPCAKEAADYTVPPRGGKAVFGLRLTFHARFRSETIAKRNNCGICERVFLAEAFRGRI
jgi:hypothetical protein